MEIDTLTELVNQGLSSYKIAKICQCGQTNVRYYLRKYKLKTQPQKQKEFCCKDCGDTNPDNFLKLKKKNKVVKHKSLCNKCHNKRSLQRQRKYKIQAIAYKGGKCSVCGYNECPAALDFHHPDPTQKEPNFRYIRNLSFKNMKKAIEPTILICCRCHRELHYKNTTNEI